MSSKIDFVDDLIDQADAYAQNFLSITRQEDDASDQSVHLPPLSLSIPSKHLTTLQSILDGDTMEVKTTTERGKGFHAKRDIKIGERLVVAKPVMLVMGCEVDDDEDDDDSESDDEKPNSAKISNNHTRADDESTESSNNSLDPLSQATGKKRNGLILLHTLQSIIEDQTIWTDTLSHLFPRTTDEALSLPPWICSDATLGMEIESLMSGLPELFDELTAKAIQSRLALIVRYNVLSVETSSEMFVYPDAEKGGMINLEATALFGPEVSFFNHSHTPNVSRYCIGDIIFFVANQPVSKGQELCFSYIEHEFLCESSESRTAMLDMDFSDGCSCNDNDEAAQHKSKRQRMADEVDDEIPLPLIDIDMQNELMAIAPPDRLETIKDMLDPQQPLNPNGDFRSDIYNLRILQAVTLENLGTKQRTKEALEEWKWCLQFCSENFPPIDETTVAIHVRAALCAHSCKEMKVAKLHAKEAVKMHDLLFGDSVRRFRKRYKHELLLKMGKSDDSDGDLMIQELWPMKTSLL